MDQTAEFHKFARREYLKYFGHPSSMHRYLDTVDQARDRGNWKRFVKLHQYLTRRGGRVTFVTHESIGCCHFEIPLKYSRVGARVLVDVVYPCKVMRATFQIPGLDERWHAPSDQDEELVTRWAALFSRHMYCIACERSRMQNTDRR